MKDSVKETSNAVLAGLVLGFLVGLILSLISLYRVGVHDGNVRMKEAAIDRGFALYCPVSGQFSWKDECTK